MQSRPDLIGMVDGVLGFMRSDALKNPGPHAAHHARISINALELIKREVQLEALSRRGCHLIQGFLFARP